MGKKETRMNENEEHLKKNGSSEEINNIEVEDIGNPEKENTQESELKKISEELHALNDKYLRLYSEFENFRKRTQKEKLDLYSTAGADIFKSLLPIIDDFERAQKAMEDTNDVQGVKQGLDLIYNKLLNTLKQQGLEAMELGIGEEFDSEKHDAITQVPAPDKKMKNKIVDVIERGYKLKDKVLRYAKVVVGK